MACSLNIKCIMLAPYPLIYFTDKTVHKDFKFNVDFLSVHSVDRIAFLNLWKQLCTPVLSPFLCMCVSWYVSMPFCVCVSVGLFPVLSERESVFKFSVDFSSVHSVDRIAFLNLWKHLHTPAQSPFFWVCVSWYVSMPFRVCVSVSLFPVLCERESVSCSVHLSLSRRKASCVIVALPTPVSVFWNAEAQSLSAGPC